MKELSNFYNKLKTKFKKLKIVRLYNKWLYKPIKFVSTAISWSVFTILLLCAIVLMYYYFSMQTYASKGAGYEPTFYLYTIISGSMYPTIEVYDVVFVLDVEDPEDIEVGDIVSYNSSSFVSGETISVTHRVVEITVDKDNNYTYYTKGDNNLAVDSNGITFEQIAGTVEFKIPQLGRLQFFLASKIGWFLIIILPALFIIIKYIIQLFNLPKLFSKIPSDSIFFPLFNKQIMLPYKGDANKIVEPIDLSVVEEVPSNLENVIVEEVNVTNNVIEKVIETENIERAPIANNIILEERDIELDSNIELKNNLETKIGNEPNNEPINKIEDKKQENSVNDNNLGKEELDINFDDIFDDLQNLTK